MRNKSKSFVHVRMSDALRFGGYVRVDSLVQYSYNKKSKCEQAIMRSSTSSEQVLTEYFYFTNVMSTVS